jgi:hypothetical protein
MNNIFLSLIVFLCFTSLTANERLTYDIHMSPYAGANDLLFGTKLVEKFQPFKDESWKMRIARLNELILFYLPLNYFTSLVQHEVFGHGYRIRDINHGTVSVASYHFSMPPPYGSGSAATHFYIDTDKITTTDLSSISIAGFESQVILANQTKFAWLEANFIDARETVLYLVSQFGINLYAEGEDNDWGHDIVGYVFPLNLTYTDSFLTEKRIRALSWINLADPFTYYSIFAWFRYVASGMQTRIPMIPIYEWGYLFGARLGLTPFGPEYYIDNYLLNERRPVYLYGKWGSSANNTYFGAGCYSPCFYKKECWNFGFRLDLWRQPELLLFGEPPYPSSEQHHMIYGAATSLICSYVKNQILGFEAELGYKTCGYLPGYSLRESPVIRLSFLSSF